MALLLALIKTLSFRKIVTLYWSYHAYIVERLFHRVIIPKHTPYLTLEPTNRCNLSCPECVTGCGEMQRQSGDMSLELFVSIIDQVYRHTIVLNLYMQGEPYLCKDLPQMIAYAKKKRLFVSLSTNAQILPHFAEEGLPHHLIVSADGATQEVYEKYRRGGKLAKVIAFMTSLSVFKLQHKTKLPYVELQFLLNANNAHEKEATKALFKGQYNRFVSKSMQVIHDEKREAYLNGITCCNRYVDAHALTPSCYKMISTTVITQEGDLVPCCMDKQANYAVGNLNDAPFSQVAQGEKMHHFHRQVISKKKQVAMCQNCPFA